MAPGAVTLSIVLRRSLVTLSDANKEQTFYVTVENVHGATVLEAVVIVQGEESTVRFTHLSRTPVLLVSNMRRAVAAVAFSLFSLLRGKAARPPSQMSNTRPEH